jgi:hypothetical protein
LFGAGDAQRLYSGEIRDERELNLFARIDENVSTRKKMARTVVENRVDALRNLLLFQHIRAHHLNMLNGKLGQIRKPTDKRDESRDESDEYRSNECPFSPPAHSQGRRPLKGLTLTRNGRILALGLYLRSWSEINYPS